MKKFFYPSSMVVFGVGISPRNLAKNIIENSRSLGFQGRIYAVGKHPGSVHDVDILTDPEQLPENIDLAVILVPIAMVAETMALCGRKGIRRVVISTGGYSEFNEQDNPYERQLLNVAKKHGIRFIGPNCIGVFCTNSGICTPFNPLQPEAFRTGRVSLIAQSGGVSTLSSYYYSEEHVGFSKIISAGNKLDINEIELIEYLMEDPDTDQIHLYLESIEDGRELLKLAARSSKPIVLFKANITRTASGIAQSHTDALSNDGRVVEGAIQQAGIVRARSIHEMTVFARAFQLPPLRGNRLLALSLSGGFAVVLADACELHGFQCPPLPNDLIQKIESYRRGGIIRMGNPMDFGDVHNFEGLVFAIENWLALDEIDGMVLSFMYGPEMAKMLGGKVHDPDLVLAAIRDIGEKAGKPIALSFFAQRQYIEQLKSSGVFPVFNTPEESVRAMQMLQEYWRYRGQKKQGINEEAIRVA
jgi:acyl-CoA synthetase (NDP forming)